MTVRNKYCLFHMRMTFADFLSRFSLQTCFISCLSSAAVRLELASEIDRIRRAPSSSYLVPTSEEYSLRPLLYQSQHYAHRSPIDGHLNAFAYTNTVGSSLTGQVHPQLITPLSAGIVTPPGLTPHQPHYTMQR
ncbi:unnamed protein product [Dicrocoelium dendriticum]|nr:unnamed protein product [Dicrocoelium dendriticum]